MIYAVILAGGVGSRFWPFSRELEPKQFMQLAGEKSLLQDSVGRLRKIISPENTYIVTNRAYLYEIEKQVKKFRIPTDNIILEPQGKNTAPAIGLCCRLIEKLDPDAVVIVMPSDHYIDKQINFLGDIKKAIACAGQGLLVTIGIKPKFPSTGYGYIKIAQKLKSWQVQKQGYYNVERFLEKPDLKKASKYYKDKNYFWNSGIFIWSAKDFLKEVKTYLPKLYQSLMLIDSKENIAKVWHKIEPVSVDYGIMEHSNKIALIPASFYWTDLGSWDALNEIIPKDKNGNIIKADVLDLNSKGICVFSRSNRLISTIGLKDLIIADTPDALLVCDKYKAQEVKKIVEKLKSANRREHFVHKTEKRPWGSYTVLEMGAGFKIKLIEIEPKKRLSLQRHKKRAEHWVVVAGSAKVTSASGTRIVNSNQSIYIPKGVKHRLENQTRSLVKIVEVQTGSYLEENDIERFSDDFKR